MAISRLTAQDATNTAGAATVTATYPGATTANNLLVACVGSHGGNAIAITGWSSAVALNNNNAPTQVAILYKIADGTETTVTATCASSLAMDLAIFEYTGNATVTPLDKTVSASSGASSVATLACGTTATLSQADELCVAAVSLGSTFSAPSWSASFTNRQTLSITSAGLTCSDLVVSSTTAVTTTASWTTSRFVAGAIATFKAAAAGAAFVRPTIVSPTFAVQQAANW